MARYRRYRRRKPMSPGQRKALEHIEQGRRLSVELGGLDSEVKTFFFSLPTADLRQILDQYEAEWGESARQYAEQAIPKWSKGSIKMSGLVAERLFGFLPRFMALEYKLELARKLWEHTSPGSYKAFVVPPQISPSDLHSMLVTHLEQVVVPHEWPPKLVERFDWLAAEEVQVKQHLMNSIRTHEAVALSTAVATHVVPIINELHLSQDQGSVRARHDFTVGKHRVAVEFRTPTPAHRPQGCLLAFALLGGIATLCTSWFLGFRLTTGL